MTLLANPLAPHTGFGDSQNTSIKFRILFDGPHAPNWEGGDPIISQHRIGNSDITKEQNHGHTPWEMTCQIRCPSREVLELLQSVAGLTTTLRYKWGITTRAGGHKQTIGDVDYLVLPDTKLVRVVPVRNDGVVGSSREATVTFRRPYVATPFVDFTLVAPDEEGS